MLIRLVNTLGSASVCRQTRKAHFCKRGLDFSVLPPFAKMRLTQYHGKRRLYPLA